MLKSVKASTADMKSGESPRDGVEVRWEGKGWGGGEVVEVTPS